MDTSMNGKAKYHSAEEGEAARVPKTAVIEGKQWGRPWTRLEILLTVLTLCLFIVVIVLCIVIALKISEIKEAERSTLETVPGSQLDLHGESGYLTSRNHGVTLPENTELCLTQECVQASARLISAMDVSVKPCDDFFAFACGSWNKVNIIPDDRPSYNTFAKLRDDIQVLLKDLLEQPVTEKDSAATRKAKYLYSSCTDEALIDEQGLEPVRALLDELGGWPMVLGPAWNPDGHDLIDAIVRLRLYNNKIFIDQWVSADDKNSEVNVIQLDQPDLGLPNRDYYFKGRDDPTVIVYEKFARDVAIMFGANATVAEADTAKMIDLEILLANITIPQDQRRDNEALYNKMTIAELQAQIPGLDWLRYLSAIFEHVNITVNASEPVVVYAPEYMQNMVQLLQQTDKRTLVNYMMWRIMMNRVTNLPSKYRVVKKEYNKVVYGSEVDRARWRDCVTYVGDNLGNAVGRLFVEKHFDEAAKTIALDMIHDIRASFYELLEEAEWMDAPTRIVAREKADAIAEKIGYPDYILNNTALDEEYESVDFDPKTYFKNVMANIHSIALSNLRRLRDPVDRTKWSTTPAVVNAFYSSTKNQIMFPAGILQPPFYNKGYPKALNYGGIGMVIGHEITHGFDDRGRQYDKDGNLIQWWDDEVIEQFKKQAQCIIDQYSNFTVTEINMQVNGVQTQGENIADNGGLKEAYRAYMKSKKKAKKETRLPGLEYMSSEQLFFLNFAQVWCGTMRPEAAINRLRTGVHSPGTFRVIGTLQNSPGFSEAFNCPPDSYMNKHPKCSVW